MGTWSARQPQPRLLPAWRPRQHHRPLKRLSSETHGRLGAGPAPLPTSDGDLLDLPGLLADPLLPADFLSGAHQLLELLDLLPARRQAVDREAVGGGETLNDMRPGRPGVPGVRVPRRAFLHCTFVLCTSPGTRAPRPAPGAALCWAPTQDVVPQARGPRSAVVTGQRGGEAAAQLSPAGAGPASGPPSPCASGPPASAPPARPGTSRPGSSCLRSAVNGGGGGGGEAAALRWDPVPREDTAFLARDQHVS